MGSKRIDLEEEIDLSDRFGAKMFDLLFEQILLAESSSSRESTDFPRFLKEQNLLYMRYPNLPVAFPFKLCFPSNYDVKLFNFEKE